MKTKNPKGKQLLYAFSASISFFLIVFYSIRLQTKGVPVLVCLILHSCCLLLLYREALLSGTVQEDSIPLSCTEATAEQKTNPLTEIYLKTIYTEVKESLIEAPAGKENLLPQEEVQLQADAKEQKDLYKTASEEAETLAQLSFPFAPASKPSVELDLIAAAKEAMDSLAVFAEKQSIKLHLSTVCETLPIKANPDSIRILFRNIIDNSIKYMGRAGHMMITISLLGDDVFIILKDTGKGLSAEETTHVFELNFQGSNRVSGNGLGLTQAKQIVEAFGGTIYAKSSIGNGMAIYIQLPAINRIQ